MILFIHYTGIQVVTEYCLFSSTTTLKTDINNSTQEKKMQLPVKKQSLLIIFLKLHTGSTNEKERKGVSSQNTSKNETQSAKSAKRGKSIQ